MVKLVSRLSAIKMWFLITLLGLPLITPFFRIAASVCTHDGHLHYHRIAALKYAWQNGLFFSRWLPDLAFGYGYPFFNYREAAPLYLTLIPHALGLPLPAAINLFYMLCILAAGWFMYLWVRDIFGPTPAIVAAVAYMAAPYQLIDAIIRGNQPESLALPLFPLLLWAGRRFVVQGSAVTFLISVFGLLFLALSHNISLLLFTPILFIYLALIVWLNKIDLKTAALRITLIFLLGLGLTSFYVGPALLELDEITISQSTTTRNNDFRFNFATLDEIFAPVHSADPSLLNRPLLIRLGWVPTILAIVGVGRYFLMQRRKAARSADILSASKEKQGHILMMVFAAIVLLLMSLTISRPLWENVPLIEFVQFPWRFIGRAALPIAFLSGTAFANYNLSQKKSASKDKTNSKTPLSLRLRVPAQVIFPSLAIIFLLLEAIPYLYPHYCLDELYPTIETVHEYEDSTGLVGVDPEGSYFPITVKERPTSSPLEPYSFFSPPRRFDRSYLPNRAIVVSEDNSPLSVEIVIKSEEPFQAHYLTFAFPGWTATIDGEKVDITPSDPEGLITFPVPAGEHTIQVRWRSTPIRQVMTTITLLSLAAVLITAVRLPVGQDTILSSHPVRQDGILSYKTLLLTAVLILSVKLLIIDNIPNPLLQEAGPIVDNPITFQANELQFAGYTLDQPSVAAGETFDIDLAWQVLAQPRIRYQSNVWLATPDGNIWSDKETQRPRIYESTSSTNFWVANQWAWDSREVRVFPGTPPGSYNIVLTLFNLPDFNLHLQNPEPVTLLTSDGTVIGPTAVIGTINVTRPDKPPHFQPQYPFKADISGLHLLGYNQDRAEAKPGEQMLITLFWEKFFTQDNLPENLNLSLIDSDGQPVQSWQIPPVRADYPPAAWERGERLRGQHLLRLAAGLESGRYQFRLEEIDLQTIDIQAPNRLFSPPEYDTAVNAVFGEQIELVGYSILLDTGYLGIQLIWQGLTDMPTSYRVFVHFLDESGQIISQSDGEPVNWKRPTTGWAVGEYVVENRTLMSGLLVSIPPGSFLRIGIYHPTTNTRLLTDSAEFIVIPLDEP